MRVALAVAAVLLSTLIAGCAATGAAQTGTSTAPRIVAAENVWGSVAAQLAGPDAIVTSLISDPATDPHSYEPTVADARQVSAAGLVIVNGLGYDHWASQLAAAAPAPDRVTLDVGSLLHLHTGENPHRWYDPTNVDTVARAITTDLTHIDPAHGARTPRGSPPSSSRPSRPTTPRSPGSAARMPASRSAPRRASSRRSPRRWESSC